MAEVSSGFIHVLNKTGYKVCGLRSIIEQGRKEQLHYKEKDSRILYETGLDAIAPWKINQKLSQNKSVTIQHLKPVHVSVQ